MRVPLARPLNFMLGCVVTVMTDKVHDSVQKKVETIFTELAGDRAQTLDSSKYPYRIDSTISHALAGTAPTEKEYMHASEVAFHLSDWSGDAAFIVALHLYPERFTTEEIEAGVGAFLVHVPAHVIAAARLSGHSTADTFLDDDHGKSRPD